MLLQLLIFCLLLFLFIYWILPTGISWYLIKRFRVKVRIGRISLPYLSLKNVHISKSGFSVQIEEVCLRSSFFTTDVTKLLSIYIRDIRINKDIHSSRQDELNDVGYLEPRAQQKEARNVPDFRQTKVPASIITFAQFMAVHVNNISVVLMNNDFDPGWFIHATAKELHLDGSIVQNARVLLVNAALTEAQAKMLRHCNARRQSLENLNKIRPCLGEVSFDVALDASLFAQGPLSMDTLRLVINNCKSVIHGGLYEFLSEAKQRTKPGQVPKLRKSRSYDNESYEKLAPLIPKNFNFSIKAATFNAVKENSQNDFSAKMQLFNITGKFNPRIVDEQAQLPSMLAKLMVQHLDIDTKYEKLLFVEQFTIDSVLERDILKLYVKLKTFQIIYNHSEIYDFVNNNFLARQRASSGHYPLQLRHKQHSLPSNLSLEALSVPAKQAGGGVLEWLMQRMVVTGCAELYNVSLLMKLDDEHIAMSVSHTRFLLEQLAEKRSSRYSNKFLNLLLNERQWSMEVMVETLWSNLGNSNNDTNNLKKTHSPGSPFFLGVSLVKLCSYANTTKLDISIHTFRTEYSMQLAEFVVKSMHCIKQYGGLSRKSAVKATTTAAVNLSEPETPPGTALRVSVKVKDITAYFVNHHNVYMLLSFSELSLSRAQHVATLKLEEFQLAIMRAMTASSLCLTDFSDVFASCKMIRLEHEQQPVTASESEQSLGKLSIYIPGNSEAYWNSNLHMHMLTLARDMQDLKTELALPVKKQQQQQQHEEPLPKLKLIIELSAERSTIVELKFSERHSIQLFVENLFFSHKQRNIIYAENVFVKIDDQHILTLKDIDMQSLPRMETLSHERLNFPGFVLPSNKVWVTNIGSFKAIFPYDHDFYDAINNEFVTHFKWLKLVHNYKKKPFTVDSPLPSDWVIKIKEFLLEISDDPFEVKLRDNYVLLVDEYLESLKRKSLFDKKIAELCSERLLVPAGTIESLYANLVKKNSEIYIQRSKKIRESGPVRTRLLAWIMNDVEILAMADTSIHGYDNVTRTMREIDSESPWPEEGLQFTTLWCRGVNISCSEWKFMLRDFPQPMFYVKSMRLYGNLCGAEQAASKRAKRDVFVDVGEPFQTHVVQRSMPSIKFYHDFDCELESCSYAFGPCWEPVMAQCNLSFEKISAPSKDPSPPLPFWDKMRLLLHGRLTLIAKQFTVLLHASLDPYNTTEEMELTWNNCGIVWTNAKIMFKGELNVTVRTASRYDDCRLLHFPNLKLTFKLNWVCLANPNDHHAVMPCAPDKLPEYSSNQVHDSFRAFRSVNLNIWVSFETKPKAGEEVELDIPSLVLYGSTLRWFESLKLILSGVTRPTRRGPVFNNVRPRKKQLSRHYKKANLQMCLHKFQVLYWMSHALHKGFQLNGRRVSFGSEYSLTLNAIDDGLIHRPRADWGTIYMNCELNDAEIWLKSIVTEKLDSSAENLASAASDAFKIVRFYFLSVAKVSYGREALMPSAPNNAEDEAKGKSSTPTHKLVVYDLKGAWTKSNRDVAFALFDSFMKSQKLKNNLSTEAVKSYRKEAPNSAMLKHKRSDSTITLSSTNSEVLPIANPNAALKKAPGQVHATAMLQQLIAEADHKFNVYSDDHSTQSRELQLQGLQACSAQDIMHENWSISLVNSQVLLKGCETSGYVIISAAKAEILQREHRPVWRDRSLISKTTWKGLLECMQYYATVSAGDNDSLLEKEIMWLTVDNIQDKDESSIVNHLPEDISHLVGSGRSVGGVVSETVGAFLSDNSGQAQPVQLQRIVSKCKCEFFYVSYGDAIDPNSITEVPPPPAEESLSPWEKQDDPVDAFTLMHHDLDVCTNSLQYAMILDIVNNLLLYVEPQRKQAAEKLARMRFQLQLHSTEDQKRPIQQKQTLIRSLLMKIRSLEKDIHLISKERIEEGDSLELRIEFERVQQQIRESKEELNNYSEELDMMLLCYKEKQLSQLSRISNVRSDKSVTMVRTNEICFKRAQWRLTETDGQIGIADLVLSAFLYTKKSKSDDSVEHLLELGNIRMENLLPREIYRDVLLATEIQKDMPVDTHKRVLRIFCREKPPVGGISVKDHFEINVAPITIAITKKFYSTMLKFCFPDRDASETEVSDELDDNASSSSASITNLQAKSSSTSSSTKRSGKSKKSSKDSEFYVKIEKDDVEKMKERAEKNKLFIYIKIPEVPVRVSYKGNKEKNLEDITDYSLVIPTLEYHNVTWTWLDLLLAMKSVSKRVIVSQAIKQKLQIHRRQPLLTAGERATPQEEDKAKMLFGNRLMNEQKNQKKGGGVFKFPSSSGKRTD
ncbi:LOW QUALITY PROTEIN: protein KIAA0100 [Drosophila busckii]|uniref:LOW QUALITY PROTEIN: protein KIAA0100 n=1 Tax=Drosophila busckii TaxID=30019 RepID=UPI0014329C91|nr:LOW QUALITY PROTEIN: protein KIAA0100 [Drosophila busckii]